MFIHTCTCTSVLVYYYFRTSLRQTWRGSRPQYCSVMVTSPFTHLQSEPIMHVHVHVVYMYMYAMHLQCASVCFNYMSYVIMFLLYVASSLLELKSIFSGASIPISSRSRLYNLHAHHRCTCTCISSYMMEILVHIRRCIYYYCIVHYI